ncbi:amino acid/polyamine transporter I [Phlyctochytrium arcticum]|nr:amino acid/polyamine transporter I [Phlyctochytrium arcticum]
MPNDGGEHNYLLAAFGPYAAYSFDWTQALLSWPLSCSAVAAIVAEYIAKLMFDNKNLGTTPGAGEIAYQTPRWIILVIAIVLLAAFTLINCLSASLGARIQTILTAAKLWALLMIAIIGFVFLAKGTHTANFKDPFAGASSVSISAFGNGLTFLLFCYGCFNNLNLMLGEMKNVEKRLPLALILSLVIVTTAYVSANVAYFAVLPLDTIRATKVIGLNVGNAAMGSAGAYIISIFIILSAMGTINALIYGNARLITASAQEAILFPRFFANVSPRFGTPIPATLFTFVISVILLFAGGADFLVKMYAFSTYVFFTLTIVGMLCLRRYRPDLPRPFKVWTPVAFIFIAVSIFVVIFPFLQAKSIADVVPYLIGIAFMLIPIPIVAVTTRAQRKRNRDVGYISRPTRRFLGCIPVPARIIPSPSIPMQPTAPTHEPIVTKPVVRKHS